MCDGEVGRSSAATFIHVLAVREATHSRTVREDDHMKTLTIDFQTGFENDTVEALLDEEVVYRDDSVTTSPLIGMADSTELAVEVGRHDLEIRLPARHLVRSLPLDVDDDSYVGVRVETGALELEESGQPFGYA